MPRPTMRGHGATMGRKRRDRAAGVFHVYTHCVWASKMLYRDDVDRSTFLRHLARVTEVVGWTCMAYCLMTSHYHLLLEVGDDVLPAGMHRLNLAHARDFNRRHRQRGHLQFAPYGADRIVDDGHLLDRFAYVVLNPVEAGICGTPEDWPWSSYSETIGSSERSFVDPSLVLGCFEDAGEPAAELERYVLRQLPGDRP